MSHFVPRLALLTFFWTFFVTAQGPDAGIDDDLLAMGYEEPIFSNTSNATNFRTLFMAMKAAELDNILALNSAFTIFAPSDKAFDTLFKNTDSDFFKAENKSDLQALLRYHIIAGKFSASNLLSALCKGQGTAKLMTVQGEALMVSIQGIDIVLTDSFGNSAKIITADTNRCNGVIHTIDSVILPSKMAYLP